MLSSPTARNFAFLLSAVSVHSTSFDSEGGVMWTQSSAKSLSSLKEVSGGEDSFLCSVHRQLGILHFRFLPSRFIRLHLIPKTSPALVAFDMTSAVDLYSRFDVLCIFL